MLPALNVAVQGQGSVGADQLNTFVQWAPSVSSLRSFTALGTMLVWMEGTTTPNDGGQGAFYYDPGATAPDDNGVTTIQPTGQTGSGRWIRQPVTLSSIPVGSITYDKLATAPGQTLIGNASGVTGPVSPLTVAQVLTMLGISTTGTIITSGMMMMWPTTVPPSGWLICDGSAVSRTAYPGLNAVAAAIAYGAPFGAGDGSTTFNVPNFLGQFPRGWDSGGTVDPGRSFGSTQADAMQGHFHGLNFTGIAGSGALFASTTVNAGQTPGAITGPITDGSHGTPRVASETRPTNVALAFIIKT